MNSYVLDGHDNDLYFFEGRRDVKRCPSCGALTQKWQETLAQDAVSKRLKADVSGSYDGVLVVSQRFRETYIAGGLTGLVFTEVGPTHWAVLPERTVMFDSKTRGTRFESRCSSCGIYAEVAGATPAFLRANEVIGPDEFVRTDIEFGSGDEQHPLIICGERAAEELRKAALKGLELDVVRAA